MSNLVTGTDGATSIPANRLFTSALVDFVASGVMVGDYLHIEDDIDTGENNRYHIVAVTTNTVTVSVNWSVGTLSGLSFRVQQIGQNFSSSRDYDVLMRMTKEAHKHVCTPRTWLVLNQLTVSARNIYGEPIIRDIITGTDGVTSIPATRRLTSSTVNFETSGVRSLENLVISGTSGDAGSYSIATVAGNILTINSNWPVGSLTTLSFLIRNVTDAYVPFEVQIPFYLKLDPPANELNKWGYESPRDAIFVLSKGICDDVGLTPKVGDRFDAYSEGIIQQFEVMDIDFMDTYNDMQLPINLVGAAKKCRQRYQ